MTDRPVPAPDFDPEAVPVRDAATVVLVRDRPGGFEAFMLQRNLKSVFVAGMHVFPGGAVDPSDREPAIEPWCRGRSDGQASAELGLAAGGLAFWVAAIREAFEEAGILLAYTAAGELVRFDDPLVINRFDDHRHAVDHGHRAMIEMCRREQIVLAVDAMHYIAHWITPLGPPRRYDTRFFVARAPDAQRPLHDDRETIAHRWIRPRDALFAHQRGELEMIRPTLHTLETLTHHRDVDSLLAAAEALVPGPPATEG